MKVWTDFDIKLSQDQAVLAEVIKRSEKLGHKIGRTALQKIPYFLERRGIPLGYSFELYHFGPFCQEIIYDTKTLEAFGVIKDSKNGFNGGSKFSAGKSFDAYVSKHSEFLDQETGIIDDVVALLAPLDATALEIVATLDYFYRYVSASDMQEPRRDEVLTRFLKAKPQYAHRQEMVQDFYDEMERIGMIGP